MNFSRILTLIIIFYVQNIFSQDLSESFLKENAQLIINESKTCVFTTIDKVGSPSSRIMDPFVPKNDFIVYLVTNPKSRKVTEIKKDPRAVLTFQNMNGYITIKGTVSLIYDLNEKNKFWKEDWTPYYKNKESALLLKVIPLSMEIVNSNAGIPGDPDTWSPVKISF